MEFASGDVQVCFLVPGRECAGSTVKTPSVPQWMFGFSQTAPERPVSFSEEAGMAHRIVVVKTVRRIFVWSVCEAMHNSGGYMCIPVGWCI